MTPNFPDGAEDSVYLAQTPPYRTANLPVTSISELLALPGFGRDRYNRLLPYISGLPPGTHDQRLHRPGSVLDALSGKTRIQHTIRQQLLTRRQQEGCFPTLTVFQSSLAGAQRTGTDSRCQRQGTSCGTRDFKYFRLRTFITIGTARFTLYSLLHLDGAGQIHVVSEPSARNNHGGMAHPSAAARRRRLLQLDARRCRRPARRAHRSRGAIADAGSPEARGRSVALIVAEQRRTADRSGAAAQERRASAAAGGLCARGAARGRYRDAAFCRRRTRRCVNGRTAVAVVTRALMSQWLAELAAAGMTAAVMCAEASLLPENPGHTVVHARWRHAVTASRRPASHRRCRRTTSAPRCRPRWARRWRADNLIFYVSPQDWQQRSSEVEALRERCASLKVQLLSSGPLPLLAPQLPQASYINLLSGEFAPQVAAGGGWRRWRLAAILAAALFAVHVGGLSLAAAAAASQ